MKSIIFCLVILALYAGGLVWKNGLLEEKKNRHIPTTPEIQRTQGTPVNTVTAKEGEFHKEFRVSGFLQKDGVLVAQVSPELIGNLRSGQKVEMREQKHSVSGSVTSIAKRANIFSGLYQVKFDFKHFPNRWIDNLKVVYIPYNTLKGHLVLPREAVSLRDGSPKVYVVKDDRVKITDIQIADANNLFFAIKSGISPGTTVINSDQRYLENGERVKVVPTIEKLIEQKDSSQEHSK